MTTAMVSRRTVIAGAAALPAVAAIGAEAAPRIERLTPAADRWFAPDAAVETIATGIRWAEGPVWVPAMGALLFSDPPGNVVRRWTRAGGAVPFLSPSGAPTFDPKITREAGANGLALARDGALLICDSGSRAVARFDLKTRQRTVLVDRYRGKRFNSPNDLSVARDGAIWFTDPPYGLADGDTSPAKELPHNGVYRWTGKEAVLIDGTLTRPNGIALSPDERRLYVAVSDRAAPRVMAYDIARGEARGARVLFDAKGLAGPGTTDGMKVARDGTLFCSTPGGLRLLSPEGEPLALIALDRQVANCAFGEGGRVLYLTASDRVLRVPLRRSATA